MALPITVPYTFGSATTAIPLSNLDSDFSTITNAVNGIGNGSVALANVQITGGTIPSANVTGLGTMATQNASNVTITGGTINTVAHTSGTFANASITSLATTFPNNYLSNSSVTIGNTAVALGSTVTSFGNVTLTNATISSVSAVLTPAQGGTGVNNSTNTITVAGNLSHTGAFTQTIAATANTSVTLPTSGTIISSVTALPGAVTGTPSSTTYLRGDGTWATLSSNSISNGTSNVTVNSSGGTVSITTAGTTAVTIDTSQNVGLGVTPSAWTSGTKAVEIGNIGNAVVSNSVDDIRIYSNIIKDNTNYKYGANGYGNLYLCGSGSGSHAWYNAPSGTAGGAVTLTQAMTLDASGNLLVGATAQLNSEKQYVYQSANGIGIQINCVNSAQNDYLFRMRAARNTTNGSFNAIGYYNDGAGAYKFIVADSGNVTNTNNSYGAISDVKLKENIVDATPKLADLLKVQVRNYTLKSNPTHKQLGVVAQELEQVFPSMVEELSDRDFDNNDLGTTTKQVKYSVFVPMLIKAIQELNTLITAQAAEITALKAKVGI